MNSDNNINEINISRVNEKNKIVDNKEFLNVKNIETSIEKNVSEKENINCKSENLDIDINKKDEIDENDFETNNDEFINADILINEEINNYGCDSCKVMDNNVIYLSNRMKDLYLDILKNYDNILDSTYHVNNNLEEIINLQNVKSKNIKMDLYNILQNKKKLNFNDISAINNILASDDEIPHITQLFRHKIVNPIIEELRF